MLTIPDELIKSLIVDWTVFEIIINISSPNSCSNLFSKMQFWNVDVVCPVVCWEAYFWEGEFYINAHVRNFKLTQWPSLSNFVYLVGLHQVKNCYTFKGRYIKTNIEKKSTKFRSFGTRNLLTREVSHEGHWFNQCCTQTYFRTVESVWVPKNWAQVF